MNLIADDEVVTELLVHYFTPENVRKELGAILTDEVVRRRIAAGYERMADRLGEPGAPARAARLIVESLHR